MLVELTDYYIEQVLNDTIFMLYLTTLLVDLITGNAVAIYERKWNSKTGINGTLRHLSLFVVMTLLLPMITYVTNIPAISNGIMLYVIAQYTISILENLSSMGVDIHEAFSKYFEYLGKSDKQSNKQDDKNRRNNHE